MLVFRHDLKANTEWRKCNNFDPDRIFGNDNGRSEKSFLLGCGFGLDHLVSTLFAYVFRIRTGGFLYSRHDAGLARMQPAADGQPTRLTHYLTED